MARRAVDPQPTGFYLRVIECPTRTGAPRKCWRYELVETLGGPVVFSGEASRERKARRLGRRRAVEVSRQRREAARPPRPEWERVEDYGSY